MTHQCVHCGKQFTKVYAMWNGAVCEKDWLDMEDVTRIYQVRAAEKELHIFKKRQTNNSIENDNEHFNQPGE